MVVLAVRESGVVVTCADAVFLPRDHYDGEIGQCAGAVGTTGGGDSLEALVQPALPVLIGVPFGTEACGANAIAPQGR